VGKCTSLDVATQEKIDRTFQGSSHSNNWAVLVCTSKFWFNYRHVSNVLSVYRSVKRLGIPDSQIILMMSDDMACNPRNSKPGQVFNNKNHDIDVYGSDVEVDYRGNEVTVENFIRVMTGRQSEDTPRSKRLMTDDRSNVLVYMTGHGGEDFLKFLDSKEISSIELADTFAQMHEKKRYNELMFVIDTCHAVSMYTKFYSPNIVSMASSQADEDSLSHHVDEEVGVFIIDRFTFHLLEFLEKQPTKPTSLNKGSHLSDMFKICPKEVCISTPGHSTRLFKRDPSKTPISDFFGSVRRIDLSADDSYFYFDVEPHNGASGELSENEPEVVEEGGEKGDGFLNGEMKGFVAKWLNWYLFALFCYFVAKSLLDDGVESCKKKTE